MTSAGQIEGKAAKLAETDRPPSGPLMQLITAGIQMEAGEGKIRAAGLCYDIRMQLPGGAKSDAIFVELEHITGLTVECWMPYTKKPIVGLRFDELVARQGTHRIFTSLR